MEPTPVSLELHAAIGSGSAHLELAVPTAARSQAVECEPLRDLTPGEQLLIGTLVAGCHAILTTDAGTAAWTAVLASLVLLVALIELVRRLPPLL